MHIQGAGEDVAIGIEHVRKPDQVVVDIPQIWQRTRSHLGKFARGHLVDGLAQRPRLLAELDQLALEIEDSVHRGLVRPGVDHGVLEAVEDVLHLVHDLHVAVHHGVQQVIGQHVGTASHDPRPRVCFLPDLADLGRAGAMHGNNEILADEHVDLAPAELKRTLSLVGGHRVHHQEEVIVILLDLGALAILLGGVLQRQLVEIERGPTQQFPVLRSQGTGEI